VREADLIKGTYLLIKLDNIYFKDPIIRNRIKIFFIRGDDPRHGPLGQPRPTGANEPKPVPARGSDINPWQES
jgi:hypothetical protein